MHTHLEDAGLLKGFQRSADGKAPRPVEKLELLRQSQTPVFKQWHFTLLLQEFLLYVKTTDVFHMF